MSNQKSEQSQNGKNDATKAIDTSTKQYTDGSNATGPGNLPALSPQQQDNAAAATTDLLDGGTAIIGAGPGSGGVSGGIGAGFEDTATNQSGEFRIQTNEAGTITGAGVTDANLNRDWTQRPQRIEPEVARVVHYWPNGTTGMYDHDRSKHHLDRQPMAAQIAYVHENGKVNLTVTDHAGNQFGTVNVLLVQPGVLPPAVNEGHYATWMPYQVEMAARGARGGSS